MRGLDQIILEDYLFNLDFIKVKTKVDAFIIIKSEDFNNIFFDLFI